MKSAAQILRSKPEQTVQTVTPSTSVFDAVKLMADKYIGALLALKDQKIAGIITERDYARESQSFLIAVSVVTLVLIFVPEIVLLVPGWIFGKE